MDKLKIIAGLIIAFMFLFHKEIETIMFILLSALLIICTFLGVYHVI